LSPALEDLDGNSKQDLAFKRVGAKYFDQRESYCSKWETTAWVNGLFEQYKIRTIIISSLIVSRVQSKVKFINSVPCGLFMNPI
jgi:hypothetical protein